MNRLFLFTLSMTLVLNPLAFAGPGDDFSPISPTAYDRIFAFRNTTSPDFGSVYAYFKTGRIYFADKEGKSIGSPDGYLPEVVYAKTSEMLTKANSQIWWKRPWWALKAGAGGTLAGAVAGGFIDLLGGAFEAFVWPYDGMLSDDKALFMIEVMAAFVGVFCAGAGAFEAGKQRACLRTIHEVLPGYPRKEVDVSIVDNNFLSTIEKLTEALDKDACRIGLHGAATPATEVAN